MAAHADQGTTASIADAAPVASAGGPGRAGSVGSPAPAPAPRGWAFHAPLQRTIGAMPDVLGLTSTGERISTWQPPTFLTSLGHVVTSEVGGVIDGDGTLGGRLTDVGDVEDGGRGAGATSAGLTSSAALSSSGVLTSDGLSPGLSSAASAASASPSALASGVRPAAPTAQRALQTLPVVPRPTPVAGANLPRRSAREAARQGPLSVGGTSLTSLADRPVGLPVLATRALAPDPAAVAPPPAGDLPLVARAVSAGTEPATPRPTPSPAPSPAPSPTSAPTLATSALDAPEPTPAGAPTHAASGLPELGLAAPIGASTPTSASDPTPGGRRAEPGPLGQDLDEQGATVVPVLGASLPVERAVSAAADASASTDTGTQAVPRSTRLGLGAPLQRTVASETPLAAPGGPPRGRANARAASASTSPVSSSSWTSPALPSSPAGPTSTAAPAPLTSSVSPVGTPRGAGTRPSAPLPVSRLAEATRPAGPGSASTLPVSSPSVSSPSGSSPSVSTPAGSTPSGSSPQSSVPPASAPPPSATSDSVPSVSRSTQAPGASESPESTSSAVTPETPETPGTSETSETSGSVGTTGTPGTPSSAVSAVSSTPTLSGADESVAPLTGAGVLARATSSATPAPLTSPASGAALPVRSSTAAAPASVQREATPAGGPSRRSETPSQVPSATAYAPAPPTGARAGVQRATEAADTGSRSDAALGATSGAPHGSGAGAPAIGTVGASSPTIAQRTPDATRPLLGAEGAASSPAAGGLPTPASTPGGKLPVVSREATSGRGATVGTAETTGPADGGRRSDQQATLEASAPLVADSASLGCVQRLVGDDAAPGAASGLAEASPLPVARRVGADSTAADAEAEPDAAVEARATGTTGLVADTALTATVGALAVPGPEATSSPAFVATHHADLPVPRAAGTSTAGSTDGPDTRRFTSADSAAAASVAPAAAPAPVLSLVGNRRLESGVSTPLVPAPRTTASARTPGRTVQRSTGPVVRAVPTALPVSVPLAAPDAPSPAPARSATTAHGGTTAQRAGSPSGTALAAASEPAVARAFGPVVARAIADDWGPLHDGYLPAPAAVPAVEYPAVDLPAPASMPAVALPAVDLPAPASMPGAAPAALALPAAAQAAAPSGDVTPVAPVADPRNVAPAAGSWQGSGTAAGGAPTSATGPATGAAGVAAALEALDGAQLDALAKRLAAPMLRQVRRDVLIGRERHAWRADV